MNDWYNKNKVENENKKEAIQDSKRKLESSSTFNKNPANDPRFRNLAVSKTAFNYFLLLEQGKEMKKEELQRQTEKERLKLEKKERLELEEMEKEELQRQAEFLKRTRPQHNHYLLCKCIALGG